MKFTIRAAQTVGELDRVYKLTHDAYVEMGYCKPQPDGRLIHYPHLDNIPETTVLIAISGGRLIGTLSLTIDGRQGLPIDADYKLEADKVRLENRNLASAWRLVTREHSRELALGLISCVVDLGVGLCVGTCLYVVNPHHERIYKRLLNMETLARHDKNIEGLTNAPSALMRWDIEKCPKKWLR